MSFYRGGVRADMKGRARETHPDATRQQHKVPTEMIVCGETKIRGTLGLEAIPLCVFALRWEIYIIALRP